MSIISWCSYFHGVVLADESDCLLKSMCEYNFMVYIYPGCGADWHENSGHCYRLLENHSPITGGASEARSMCRRLGADLAIINTQEDNNFAVTLGVLVSGCHHVFCV